MIFIIMGVSGCGKTTVGQLLAQRLGLPFFDADDFHTPEHVAKMRGGIPLNDEDRQGWLELLAEKIKEWDREGGAVLACSALKEKYREILQSVPASRISWILLNGDRSVILQRMEARKDHYMSSALLDSQIEALEKPAYGLELDVCEHPEVLVRQIIKNLKTMNTLSEFGLIGLGVMGKSLALNLAGRGVKMSIFNRHVPAKEVDVAKNVIQENPSFQHLKGFDELNAFVNSLERPRRILLMIVAGEVVDFQIKELLPLLDAGDVLIDGGNSYYKDTARRTSSLADAGIHFVGTGISGGEEGARKGPSIMPGGAKEGYELIARYLKMIAARDRQGKPCTAYIGPEGAGHFVKMVHNGIEYAEMQVLAETYYLLRYFLTFSPEEIAALLSEWQKEGLDSYLLEITIDILRKKEDNELLLDKILDQAGQKGTGGWSVAAALEHGVPYSSLTEAVMARNLSALKEKRVAAAALYQQDRTPFKGDKKEFAHFLRQAYQATRIINHEIGFSLMREVSDQYKWSLNLSEIARVWTNGCIIRSELMEELSGLYKKEESILMAPLIQKRMKEYRKGFSSVVARGVENGFALPVLSAALNYFLGYITANSPANLLQAQRDYFGAHTYRRKDRPGEEYFHTIWKLL